ncbi:MAG: MOP flippase family protein [Candidatus Omnitrophota bacterium]|nr:MOP flippase family protein [Candidatus Omnitrophota bacterium]
MVDKSLKKDFISGIKWTTAARFGAQGVQFITTFILARLLSPAEFGLVGLAGVFLLIANHVSQLGISSAIIQKKDIDESYLSSAFWTNIFVGLLLTVGVFFLSWPAASFFDNDNLRPIIQVLSLIYFLGSLRIVQNALFTKRLQFKKIAFLEVISVIISGTISVGMAAGGFGVWSLVYGRLAYVLTSLVMAWLLSSWRPRFVFNRDRFNQFFSFGLNVMCTNILSSCGGSVSTAVIGKFLNIASVGIFNMSMNIIYFPSRLTTMILSGVMFPILSHMQEDTVRLKAAYFNVLKTIAAITFPALIGMACVTPEFVKVVLGAKWVGIINPIRVLFVVGMIDSIVATVGSVFCSKGRPEIELKADLALLAILLPLIFLGLRFGLMGIAVAMVLHRILSISIFFILLKPLLNYRIAELLTSIFLPIRDSIIMGLAIMAYRSVFSVFFKNEFFLLLTSVLLGVSLYLLILKLFNSYIFTELKRIIADSFKDKILAIFRRQRCSVNP